MRSRAKPDTHTFFELTLQIPEHAVEHQIQLDDNWQDSSPYFEEVRFIDSIDHPLARDPGYLFFKTGATEDLRPVWREIVVELKKEAGIYQE